MLDSGMGDFGMKNLEELRTNLLALSLNVGLIERDIRNFNKRPWRSAYDAPFNSAQRAVDEEIRGA
jgi:hypothetical protein